MVFLTGQDYENRGEILQKMHDTALKHIETGEVSVAAGIAEYDPDVDSQLHSVFEKADALMYTEKKLLKSLGASARL